MPKYTDFTKKSKWKILAPVQTYTTEHPYQWVWDDQSKYEGHNIIDPTRVGPILDVGTECVFNKRCTGCNVQDDIYLGLVFDTDKGYIPYDLLKNNVELIEQPAEIVYYIRDSATGFFHKDNVLYEERHVDLTNHTVQDFAKREYYNLADGSRIEYRNMANVWSQNQVKTDIDQYEGTAKLRSTIPGEWYIDIKYREVRIYKKRQAYLTYHAGKTYEGYLIYAEWAKKPGSGHKMKNLAQAKQRLLFLVGYHNNTDSPDMLNNYRPIDEIPDTWEIVSYDKVTKNIEVIEQAKSYMDTVNRLKGLTKKFGSAVRDLYKTLEKKNELGTFKGFLAFNIGDLPGNSPLVESIPGNWSGEDYYKLIPYEVQEVKRIIKKDMRKSIQATSCAIAVASVSDAVMLKLKYGGKMNCHVIDMETLTENVE